MLFLFYVYLRFLSSSAAAMTAIMMTTAVPAINRVSVEIPVPGVGATVGDGLTVKVGATVAVGAIVAVAETVGITTAAAESTPTAVVSLDGQ